MVMVYFLEARVVTIKQGMTDVLCMKRKFLNIFSFFLINETIFLKTKVISINIEFRGKALELEYYKGGRQLQLN